MVIPSCSSCAHTAGNLMQWNRGTLQYIGAVVVTHSNTPVMRFMIHCKLSDIRRHLSIEWISWFWWPLIGQLEYKQTPLIRWANRLTPVLALRMDCRYRANWSVPSSCIRPLLCYKTENLKYSRGGWSRLCSTCAHMIPFDRSYTPCFRASYCRLAKIKELPRRPCRYPSWSHYQQGDNA